MKEIPLSTTERQFITNAIKQNLRLDGRKNDEFRAIEIHFGIEWGSVIVSMGTTKILGQVSCELGIPKATRPNEGMMYINVELGPMAAPHFEAGRNSDLNVQITRTLERVIKDSRCVDLESLCVTSEERVWVLRVDLNVLNHEGNLIDCSSIAALCALMHFKRPDVSIVDDEVHIHTAAEKEPIPIVLHHYPVCVSYGTFDAGRIAVADPSALEERTAESLMIFGINSYRELCCLNLGGTTLTSSFLLLQCSRQAARHAKFIVDRIKQALSEDMESRENNRSIGFIECLNPNKITGFAENRLSVKLRNFNFSNIHERANEKIETENEQQSDSESQQQQKSIIAIGTNSVILNANSSSNIKWVPDEDDDEDENIVNMHSDNETSDEDNGIVTQNNQNVMQKSNQHASVNDSLAQNRNSDSEEETKMVL